MNTNEALIAAALEKRGFYVIRNGWPDFLCTKRFWDGTTRSYLTNVKGVMAVEVKAGNDTLSENQGLVHAVLKAAGVPVYVIRPEELDKARALRHATFLTTDQLREAQNQLLELKRKVSALEGVISSAAALIGPANDVLQIAYSPNGNVFVQTASLMAATEPCPLT